MSVCDTEVMSGVIAKLCSSLLNEDKRKRKKALEELSQEILKDRSDPALDDKINQAYRPILRCFDDKAETIRECAANLIIQILPLTANDSSNHYLPYLVPILGHRIGLPEIVESSEEVRLVLVSLLRVIIGKYQDKVASYLDDFVKILVRTVVDPYPNVKKESCECAAELAKAIPRHFHLQSESLIKPVLLCFTHQHYKVRVSAINSIGQILLHGNNKSIDEVCGPLAERLFDSMPMVRQAVNNVVGMWLLHLRDRYSYFHKLLPILLSSLSDELPETRKEAWSLWEAAGKQYMEENENDLKDQMDFLSAPLEHYPEGAVRPNLGCRTLASRNLSKIVPPLCRELSDWLSDVRVKSAQLLCVLLLNAEVQMTHHLEKILPSMYKAACDQDHRLVQNIEVAALYIGYFVPCETYWPLVLPTIEDNTNAGHLRVFAAILRGTQPKQLVANLEDMADFISREEVCRSKEPVYQQQVLSCCEAIITVCNEDCVAVTRQLFNALVTVLGLAASHAINDRATELLAKLTELSSGSLYEQHMLPLLQSVKKTVESWNVHCPERYIFEALLSHSGPTVGRHLDDVVSILTTVLNPEKDAELRLKFFIALSSLLTNHETSFQLVDNVGPYLTDIIKNVISPSLVWHGGRAAEAIRTAAVCCLVAATRTDPFSDRDTLSAVSSQLVPLVLSLVEDSSRKTRLHSMTAVRQLVNALRARHLLTRDTLHTIYPVVLRRLDDASDECRLASVRTLTCLFSVAPVDYDVLTARPHLDALFNSMLIHLDDSDPAFQAAMLDALKETGKMCPQLLLDKVNGSKQNFRNKKGLDELVEFLQNRLE